MKTHGTRSSAFSLVEVTLALGIAAFALLAIFGLLPIGLNSNQTSVEQTTATNLITGIIADLRQIPSVSAIAANPSLPATSPRYGFNVATASAVYCFDESGGPSPATTAPSATSRYRVTITFQPATGRTATRGNIQVSWPAPAANPAGSVSAFVALDRN